MKHKKRKLATSVEATSFLFCFYLYFDEIISLLKNPFLFVLQKINFYDSQYRLTLLDSDEILEYIYDYGYTSEQIARAMHTDINLVALKIAHLAETGHKLRRMEYRSSFLK